MSRNLFVRREVEEAKAYSPGLSVDEIRDLYSLERVIKLASNENPLGTSPRARRAVERAAGSIFRYARSGSPRLAEAIAAMHRVNPECVVLGNGSDEVIDLLIRCRAEPGRHNIVTFNPCYSLYALQAGFCGVERRVAPLRKDLSFDWGALLALVDELTSLVFVTTPDNPSGYCPPARELENLAGRLPAGTLLVLDEAYMDFAAYADGAADGALADYSLLPRFNELDNVIILRTFSKSYGLAGLRLGYGLMPAALAGYIRRVRLPFSVNILAEAAGLAVLQDRDFHLASLREVERGRDLLSRELAGLGCLVHPSRANFIMFGPPSGTALNAAELFEALLRRGVIIRRLDSYGLPGFLRVSVGSEEENRLFLDYTRELLATA